MPRTSAPVSRRDRPAKPPLTRELVVRTGLVVLDRDGIDALTMRRVAQELDTGAASLYVYVAHRDDLLAAMLEEALGEVPPAPVGGTWQERLHVLIGATVHVLTAHEGLAVVAFGQIPTGRNVARIIDAMIGLLTEGGIEPVTAAWAVDLLYLLATAEAADHRGYIDKGGTQVDMVREAAERLAALPPGEYPHLAALAPLMLADGDRSAWFRQVLINGILSTPRE
jgi:AcrR family transcriptional regulator